MTRSKELRRIEAAIARNDEAELRWALGQEPMRSQQETIPRVHPLGDSERDKRLSTTLVPTSGRQPYYLLEAKSDRIRPKFRILPLYPNHLLFACAPQSDDVASKERYLPCGQTAECAMKERGAGAEVQRQQNCHFDHASGYEDDFREFHVVHLKGQHVTRV